MFSHRAWIRTPRSENGVGALEYPLAADVTKSVSRDYGVLVEEEGVAMGILQYKVVTSMNVGRSVDETLRVLQALQTGGLCPANWEPGQKTLR